MTIFLHCNKNKASKIPEIINLWHCHMGHASNYSLKHILFPHIDTSICSPYDVCHFAK